MPTAPNSPIPVSYQEYETYRDDGIQPESLNEGSEYTARLMLQNPTTEKYALDFRSKLLKISHLGAYSLVKMVVYEPTVDVEIERGISLTGILFLPKPLPQDLEFIPHKSEFGYFVDEASGSSGDGASADISEEIEVGNLVTTKIGEMALV